MLLNDEYRHVSTSRLILLAARLRLVFASSSAWYRQIRLHNWRRPRTRLYPAKPKVGIRASKANEIWHVDTSIIKLLDGTKTYLCAVIDNYSRRILGWKLSKSFDATAPASLLEQAAKDLPEIPKAMVDSGIENLNQHVDALVERNLIHRVIAQIDIMFSNSMIEAFWKQLKHNWLYLNELANYELLEKHIHFYVEQHNSLPHTALRGLTPNEAHSGTGGTIVDDLKQQAIAARAKRIETNRDKSCKACRSNHPELVQLKPPESP
jgi:putative transposase